MKTVGGIHCCDGIQEIQRTRTSKLPWNVAPRCCGGASTAGKGVVGIVIYDIIYGYSMIWTESANGLPLNYNIKLLGEYHI